MYTMQPLADIPPSHVGFWIVATFSAIFWVLSLLDSTRYEKILSAILWGCIVGFAWLVSYVWTDQTTIVHKNEQVTGEFVRFVAEGYNEEVRSGKQTRRVDVHKTYVVYKINGQEVMFEGSLGTAYPPRATFYKN